MPSLPALPDPTTTAVTELTERCAMLAAWVGEQDDLRVLDEARKWLAGVEAYLARKGQAGPAQTAARLTEARIVGMLMQEMAAAVEQEVGRARHMQVPSCPDGCEAPGHGPADSDAVAA